MIEPNRILAGIPGISQVKYADPFIQHLEDRMLLAPINRRIRNPWVRKWLKLRVTASIKYCNLHPCIFFQRFLNFWSIIPWQGVGRSYANYVGLQQRLLTGACIMSTRKVHMHEPCVIRNSCHPFAQLPIFFKFRERSCKTDLRTEIRRFEVCMRYLG